MIASRTGINFNFDVTTQPFSEALNGVMQGKGPDLITSMMYTPERSKRMLFSKEYIRTPRVIFTEKDADYVDDINDLSNKVIAIQKGSVVHKEIIKNYNQIKLKIYDSPLESLIAVSMKQADAYIGNLTVGSFLILQNGLSNIKVAAPAEIGKHVFSMGIRQDWPELQSIINKGLDSISLHEKLTLRNKYISVNYELVVEDGIKPYKVYVWLMMTFLVAITIFGIFLIWNRRLSKEINARVEVEKTLQTHKELFSSIVQDLPGLVCRNRPDGIIEFVNDAYCQYFGKESDELIGSNFLQLVPESERDNILQQLSTLKHDNLILQHEHQVIDKNGNIRWQNWTNRAICDEYGKVIAIQAFGEDITEAKESSEKLHRAQVQYQQLAQNINAGLVVHSLDSSIIYFNDKSSELLGLTAEQMMGKDAFDPYWKFLREDGTTMALEEFPVNLVLKNQKSLYNYLAGVYIPATKQTNWLLCNAFMTTTYEGEEQVIVTFVDITERKQAELELQQREQLFHAVFNQQFQFMAILSNEGRTLEINELALKTQGVKSEDYIGKLIWESPAWNKLPEWKKTWQQRLGKVRNMNKPLLTEDIYTHKDGSRRYADASTLALRMADGTVSGFLIQTTDTTEHKLAIAQAKDTDVVLSSIFQLLNDMFFLLESDGTIFDYRAKQESPFYVKPEIFLGKQMQNVLPTKTSSIFLENFQKARNGKLVNFEYPLPINGKECYFEARLVKQSETERYVMVVSDISERKNSDMELSKLAQAVKQSPESIMITNTDAEIEYVNEAFITTSGYSLEEVIGQNPNMLQSGKTKVETYKVLWERMQQGLSWHGELHNKRKDGSEYLEFAIITPIFQNDGTISHYVAVKEDITEKKRIGLELDEHRHHLEKLIDERTAQLTLARKQAEDANNAKSTFLANMSHEIRTPMNGILGMTHLAMQAKTDEQKNNYLSKAHLSAENLLRIINDILDFSKIEAGKLEVEAIEFKLESLIKEMHTLIEDSAINKDITLNYQCDESYQYVLIGDPLRLRQILTNLVSNAIKFTSSAGEVGIQAKILQVVDDDIELQFSVSDTGIGMSQEQQDKLFESFSQADSSTTRKYGGTGLGLIISKSLCEAMQGKMWLESKLDEGSTFYFTIKLNIKAIKPSIKSDVENNPNQSNSALDKLHGTKILLVEDDDINQEIAVELLREQGINVEVANNGQEALDILDKESFDGVLMDCMMPVMDGYQATIEIRKQSRFKDLPVLAMTANAMKQDIDKAFSVGMNAYITKPIDINSMLTTMAKWIESKVEQNSINSDMNEVKGLPQISQLYGVFPEDSTLIKKPKLYHKILLSYEQKYIGFESLFRTDLADNDFHAAEIKAHSLKGLSATLGISEIQKLAFELEVACRENNDNIEKVLSNLVPELNRVISGIKQMEQ